MEFALTPWRALCVCPCGDPYCWCEIFKVQRLSPWLYCKWCSFSFLERNQHIPVLISNIFLDTRLEMFELPDKVCDGFLQMYSFLVLNLAKNQKVQ